MALAIFRQHVSDVEVGQVEDVAQVLLVLVAIEAAEGTAAVAEDVDVVGLVDGLPQAAEQGGALGVGERDAFRGHFAIGYAVVDADPAVAERLIVEARGKRGEIEPTHGVLGVVTAGADGGDERLGVGCQGG
jgi:hypothetical protein